MPTRKTTRRTIRGTIRGTHHIAKRAARLLRDEESTGGEPDDLLTAKQLADKWGYAVITLESWRRKGNGPQYVNINGRIKYPRGEAKTWLKEQLRPRTRKFIRRAP